MEYTIESGDSLTGIARRYNTTVGAVIVRNSTYGAIGINSCTGGGRGSCVMGRSEGSDRLFKSGENQGELPLYDTESLAAGSEA